MKKILSILLVLAMLACFAPAVFAASSLGDIDNDGHVTASDARIALRAAVGLDSLSSTQKARANVDGDSSVTAADARLILRVAVQLAEVSSDGTRIVDRLTADEKLRNFLTSRGGRTEDGQYMYGYTVEDDSGLDLTFVFVYKPGVEKPFCTFVYYEKDGYTCETQVWFNSKMDDYETIYLLYDDSATYFGAQYYLYHSTICYDNRYDCLSTLRFEGDEDQWENIRQAAGNLSYLALRELVGKLYEANVGIDYAKDMHLLSLYE